jgi:hypothetical protein
VFDLDSGLDKFAKIFRHIMHSNANRRASGSNPNNGYAVDPGSSTFPTQFPLNTNGMQWSPQSPIFPPFPPSMQNNAWPLQQSQQQHHLPPNQILNGMSVGHPVPMQQTPQFDNNLGLLPANILQDVFRLSVPVGSSPNDDTLLVQVLKDSAQKGQTYKQAIETLHGVSHKRFISVFCAQIFHRSTIMRPIFGKTIIWTISLV